MAAEPVVRRRVTRSETAVRAWAHRASPAADAHTQFLAILALGRPQVTVEVIGAVTADTRSPSAGTRLYGPTGSWSESAMVRRVRTRWGRGPEASKTAARA